MLDHSPSLFLLTVSTFATIPPSFYSYLHDKAHTDSLLLLTQIWHVCVCVCLISAFAKNSYVTPVQTYHTLLSTSAPLAQLKDISQPIDIYL